MSTALISTNTLSSTSRSRRKALFTCRSSNTIGSDFWRSTLCPSLRSWSNRPPGPTLRRRPACQRDHACLLRPVHFWRPRAAIFLLLPGECRFKTFLHAALTETSHRVGMQIERLSNTRRPMFAFVNLQRCRRLRAATLPRSTSPASLVRSSLVSSTTNRFADITFPHAQHERPCRYQRKPNLHEMDPTEH